MILTLLSLLSFAPPAPAAVAPEDKLWQRRLVVLLGDQDIPAVRKQATILQKGEAALREREVEILAEQRPSGLLHKRFGHGPGFLVILLGKDGEEKFRSPKPVALDKITKLIDEMPMRKDEVQEREEKEAKKLGT